MDNENEMKDIVQTSKKVENISKKAGLREGISAGRDSNFQESFDKGFEEGFRNGFLLGKYRGTIMAESKQTSTNERMHVLLENVSTGSCKICKNENSTKDEENIDKLVEIQSKSYETNIETLALHFAGVLMNQELLK